jgi:hypothetical protein
LQNPTKFTQIGIFGLKIYISSGNPAGMAQRGNFFTGKKFCRTRQRLRIVAKLEIASTQIFAQSILCTFFVALSNSKV